MGFGDILSFISPAAGAATGKGIGEVLPYLSPAYGLASGKGLGALLGQLFGGQGQQDQGGDPSPMGAMGAMPKMTEMQTNPVASKMPLGGTNYAADPFGGGQQKQDFGAMLRQFLGNLQ